MKILILFCLSILFLDIYPQSFEIKIINSDTFKVLPNNLQYSFYERNYPKSISLPDGKWLQIENNLKKYEFSLENNLLNGEWKEYNSKSLIKQKGFFFNGEKTGPFFTYRDSGEIFSIYYFYQSSTSEVCFFYNNGNIESRAIGISDSITLQTFFYENGMKEYEGCIKKGKILENGLIEQFNIDEWKYWYENGVLKLKGCFIHGKRNSVWNNYNDKDEFIKSEYYIDGVLVKESKTNEFDIDGSIKGIINN
ncbi:MAG: hypothetical protein WCK02_17340 [Bacteroidota bacterium]